MVLPPPASTMTLGPVGVWAQPAISTAAKIEALVLRCVFTMRSAPATPMPATVYRRSRIGATASFYIGPVLSYKLCVVSFARFDERHILPLAMFFGSFSWSFVYISLPFHIQRISTWDAAATLT